jgi:hypothetical protein
MLPRDMRWFLIGLKKLAQAAPLCIVDSQADPQSFQVWVANKMLPRDMRCFLIGLKKLARQPSCVLSTVKRTHPTILLGMSSQLDSSAGHEVLSDVSKKSGQIAQLRILYSSSTVLILLKLYWPVYDSSATYSILDFCRQYGIGLLLVFFKITITYLIEGWRCRIQTARIHPQ